MKTCRYCGNPVFTPADKKDITWMQRSKGWFYHLSCWHEFISTEGKSTEKTDDQWFDLIFDVLKRELKSSYNFHQIKKQCENMIKDGMTMKGIYYAVNYIFLIKNTRYEPKYGLGLIPHIYEESANYWYERWLNEEDIFHQIERLQEMRETDKKIILMKEKKKKPTPEPDF